MSMLAERKRKQKWSLNPRGKVWSQDSNKFGQKLLEKMGWSSGKGLGAKEDGRTEHIKVTYKNDSQGMGYKDNDNQWTEHESNFSALLKTLGGEKNEDTEIKLNSLEKKSETSRARVHYRKFTRGKDLSRYSEKDLANIFGKKHLTEKKDGNEDNNECVNVEQDNKFSNAGSMTDYFKNKSSSFQSVHDNVSKKNDDSESENETRSGFGFGTSFNDTISNLMHNGTESVELPRPSDTAQPLKHGLLEETLIMKSKAKRKLANDPESEVTPSKQRKREQNKNKRNSKELGLCNPAFSPNINVQEVEMQNEQEFARDKRTKGKKMKEKAKSPSEHQTLENSEEHVLGSVDSAMDESETKYKGVKNKKMANKFHTANLQDDRTSSKKKKKATDIQVGIENPFFDISTEDESSVVKIPKNSFEAKRKNRSKKKKFNGKENNGVENPSFDLDSIVESGSEEREVERSEQPKKRKRNKQKVIDRKGIDNPSLQLNQSAMESCDLILNISNRPIETSLGHVLNDGDMTVKKPKRTERRKSVRFSDVTRERIIPTKEEINNEALDEIRDIVEVEGKLNDSVDMIRIGKVMMRKKSKKIGKNVGVENKAFDHYANKIEENLNSISNRLETFQVEIENDINETKVKSVEIEDAMIGEAGNPGAIDEKLPDGNIKLKFRQSNSKRSPYLDQLTGAKKSYQHLIKGDLLVYFKDSNLHEVEGYATSDIL